MRSTFIPRGPCLKRTVELVATSQGIPEKLIFCRSNEPHVVRARAEVMVRLRQLGWSLHRIGNALGGYSHTTVDYHLRKAERTGIDTHNAPIGWSSKLIPAEDYSGEWAI